MIGEIRTAINNLALTEAEPSEVAKQTGLTYVGWGIYTNMKGGHFKWGGYSFVPVDPKELSKIQEKPPVPTVPAAKPEAAKPAAVPASKERKPRRKKSKPSIRKGVRIHMIEIPEVDDKGQPIMMSGKNKHKPKMRHEWQHLDGTPVPERLRGIKIPPYWSDTAVYDPDPDADLMVCGKDKKGHWQPIYSAKHVERASFAKFERVKRLDGQVDEIMAENTKNMASDDVTTSEHAGALNLIFNVGLRPGSEKDTGAEEQAYGCTTLQGQHVISDGDIVHLRFTGKHGVALDLPVPSHLNADIMHRAATAGPDGKVFSHISEKSLLNYVKGLGGGSGYYTKDFRTLLGCRTAQETIDKYGDRKPKSDAEYEKWCKAVATAVSKKLGNTWRVCLKSYINPVLFSPWRLHDKMEGVAA